MTLVLLLFVGGVPGGDLAHAGQPDELNAAALGLELDQHLGDQGTGLRPLMVELEGQRVPLALVQRKLREGRAKKVPPARIAATLKQLGDNLLWTQQRLASCRALGEDSRASLLELTSDLLWSGLGREPMGSAIAECCAHADPLAAMNRAGEAHLHLVNRLDATPTAAWAFSSLLIHRDDSRGDVNRLITVFHDIQRKRGTVDRVLERATKRLRDGASLRAVRNELREQFLDRR